LDDPNSALSKKIAFIVKGKDGKPSDYVSIVKTAGDTRIQLAIKDDSIFVPGNVASNAQHGFRRTDVNPLLNTNATLTGVTTWYQTIRLDSKAPLNLIHGYLLSSIEGPTGDHRFDIFAGSDFLSDNLAHKPTPNSETIRVRDLSTKTLLSLPLKYDQDYNFAVTVDADKNTLAVASSIGSAPLQPHGGPMPNDPKAMTPEFKTKGEFHIQLIKMPLPDAKDPPAQRGDTPHRGIQEHITNEHVMFSNVFATKGTQLVNPHLSKGKKGKACKRKLI